MFFFEEDRDNLKRINEKLFFLDSGMDSLKKEKNEILSFLSHISKKIDDIEMLMRGVDMKENKLTKQHNRKHKVKNENTN